MSLLRGLFRRSEPINNNNNDNNFTQKAPRLNRSLNTLYKKSKETLNKRKKNREHSNDPNYPYGTIFISETNNPLVPHSLGRKLYIACVHENYDIALSLFNDIINTDITQLDYIDYQGQNGTPLLILASFIIFYSVAERINSPDSKAKLEKAILLIKKIINAGANLDFSSHEFHKSTVISYLIDYINDVSPTVYSEVSDIIYLLLNKGANLNIIDDLGRTTLDITKKSGKLDLAGEIFAKGGRTSEELTPQLFESCLALREKVLLTISDIDKRKLGIMLLRECTQLDINTPLILTYISEGADLNIIGNNTFYYKATDKAPLLWLCSKIAQLFEEGSQSPNRLNKVMKECDNVAVILIKAGADLDMLDTLGRFSVDGSPDMSNGVHGSGYNALMYTIKYNYYNTPRVLIEHGAKLNTVFKGSKDETALDMAIAKAKYVKEDSLVNLIREKGGLTAKELSGTIENWTQKSMVKKGGGYRRKTRKLHKKYSALTG